MYKLYLSPALDKNIIGCADFGYEEYRMAQIASVIEQELINDGNFIIYRNMEDMTLEEIIDDSNNIRPNAHIAIRTKDSKKTGIVIEVNENNVFSNALGKEILKQLINVYYKKEDNIIVYSSKKKEITETASPAVTVFVGSRENEEDVNWIVNNVDKIGKMIAEGIKEYFKLKKC